MPIGLDHEVIEPLKYYEYKRHRSEDKRIEN